MYHKIYKTIMKSNSNIRNNKKKNLITGEETQLPKLRETKICVPSSTPGKASLSQVS